jgi:hypothetical protein
VLATIKNDENVLEIKGFVSPETSIEEKGHLQLVYWKTAEVAIAEYSSRLTEFIGKTHRKTWKQHPVDEKLKVADLIDNQQLQSWSQKTLDELPKLVQPIVAGLGIQRGFSGDVFLSAIFRTVEEFNAAVSNQR